MRLRAPLSKLVKTTPVLELINWLSRNQPRVLLYHRFAEQSTDRRLGVDIFDAQMRLLRDRFNLMSASQLCDAFSAGRSVKNAVVVTIDDGYEDVHRYALPVMRAYRIPATLYVTTGFVDGAVWLWPDAIDWMVYATSRPNLHWQTSRGVCDLALISAAERRQAWRVLATHYEGLEWDAAGHYMRELAISLDVQLPDAPTAGYRAMSWSQLREMAAAGIEIGDHTWCHPVLTNWPLDRVRRELVDSRALLRRQLGVEPRSFAYPHGASNAAIRAAVREVGYANAMGTDAASFALTDVYNVKRLGNGDDLNSFRSAVYGVRFLALRLGISI